MTSRSGGLKWGGICLLVFATACAMPALEFRDTNSSSLNVMAGYQVLAVGWLGLFAGQLAWYANPCFALGLLLLALGRRTGALVSGLLGVLIACDTFVLFSQHLPANEGGVGELNLQHLRSGFFVWALALVLLPVGALVLRRQKQRALSQPGPSLA